MGRGWSEQRRGEAGEAKGADFEPTVSCCLLLLLLPKMMMSLLLLSGGGYAHLGLARGPVFGQARSNLLRSVGKKGEKK